MDTLDSWSTLYLYEPYGRCPPNFQRFQTAKISGVFLCLYTCRDPVSCPWCRRWAWPTPWRRSVSGRWGWSSPTSRVCMKVLFRIFVKIPSFRIEKSSYFNVPESFLDNFLEMQKFSDKYTNLFTTLKCPTRNILSFVKMYTFFTAIAMLTLLLTRKIAKVSKNIFFYSVRIIYTKT
jgi:hypothetical protein